MRLILFTLFIAFCCMITAKNASGQGLSLLNDLYSKKTRKIPVGDSVSLVADVYMPIPKKDIKVPVNVGPLNIDSLTIFPAGQQYLIYDSVNGKAAVNPRELPFLLQRTPYKRSGQEGLGVLAFFGYGVMIQNNRGRYESEGVYYPFVSNTWETQAYHPAFNHALEALC
jgi:predicted acyl esterase